MISFNSIDILLFLGISQGVFLALMIQVIQHKNRLANRTLSLILIVAAIMLTGRFFYTRGTSVAILFRVALFVDILIFVFGPLLFLYYKRLLYNEASKYRLPFIHFVPALGMFTYHLWTYRYTQEEFIVMANDGRLWLPFVIIETVGLLSNYYYGYKSFTILQEYKKEEQKNLSYSQRLTPYLTSVLITVFLFLLLWTVSYVLYYFFGIYSSFVSYNAIWIAICVFIYCIGFYSLKQPEFFRVPIPVIQSKSIARNRVSGEALHQLTKNLEYLMVEEKIYLDHRLTLTELAQKLNTSTNDLSWLLNTIHKSSFYDYINTYRVQEFIEKIHEGAHHRHTILALSLDSGFTSKSTFNKAFKTVVQDTPSNYIKKMEAA
ncbi:helix-turn-helix transcriptional regulator [Aquimarina sp. U1-2]|uniref:helix-turn-helix domain-containing protein n=1 Tax=Aquimarina sp. U1-2 TaxID=2823141 RepID=UPI001AECF4CD|nr:AraC family transcriptional regulator [Aquimarina sp. U1-2]MBP2833170.1 helix-turn-helix transcriptional regulator [Aquimarina sp. U1-2]